MEVVESHPTAHNGDAAALDKVDDHENTVMNGNTEDLLDFGEPSAVSPVANGGGVFGDPTTLTEDDNATVNMEANAEKKQSGTLDSPDQVAAVPHDDDPFAVINGHGFQPTTTDVATMVKATEVGEFHSGDSNGVATGGDEPAGTEGQGQEGKEEEADLSNANRVLDGDLFGDFSGGTAAQPDEAPTTEEKGAELSIGSEKGTEPPTPGKEDLFGDFSAVGNGTDVADADSGGSEKNDLAENEAEGSSNGFAVAQAAEVSAQTEDSAFGEFKDVPATPQQTEQHENFDENDGDNDVPSSQNDGTETAASQEETPTAKEDFGDFGDATVPAEPTSIEPEEAPQAPKDDDFGDFGDFNEAEPTAAETSGRTSEAPAPPKDQEDVFGGFDGVKPPVLSPESQPQQEKAVLDNNEDDFGDFGDFADAKPVPAETEPPTEQDEDQFGEFGDLGDGASAPQETGNGVESAPTPAPVEDDFGDFGDFNAGPSTSSQPPETGKGVEPVPAPEEDDFGDFGDFNAGSSTSAQPHAPATSNGEVGGSGESSAEREAVTTAQAEPVEAQPQAPEEEDFEDFGDFGEAQAEQDTPQPQVTLTQSDPSTERWQSLFSHLFGQKTEAEGDSGIEGTGESVGVREVLESIVDSSGTKEDVRWSKTELKAQLKAGGVMQSGQRVIANDMAIGPYSHYLATSGTHEMQESQPQQQALLVPEVVPIELPTPKDGIALSRESSALEQPGVGDDDLIEDTPPTPSEVKLDFSDFKAPSAGKDSGGEDNGMSGAAKLFLQQIPDLSFMLATSLSLPRKKT